VSCFAAALGHLRRYVTDDCFRSLVQHTGLDYGNFVLIGLPSYLQRRLQSVLNDAARLVFRLSRYDNVSDTRPTQPPTLSGTGNEYQPKCGMTLCGWGVKAGMAHSARHVDKRVVLWVAGKTV